MSLPLIVHSSEISYAIISSDAAMLNWDLISGAGLRDLDHNNQVRLLMGSVIPARAYQKAMRLRDALRRQILGALDEVDALAMPASSVPATLIPQAAGVRHERRRAGRLQGTAGLHGALQPGQPAGSVHQLRVHGGRPAHRLAAGRARL